MKKFLIVVLIIILIPMAVVCGAIGFLKFADLNKYKPDIENLALKYADLDVKINGNIGVAVSLKPTIELNDVDISNHNDGMRVAHIGSAFVEFSVLPLLRKEVVADKVLASNTEIFYNKEDSVLINDLDVASQDYSSPINISFDTAVAGIGITGNAVVDSLEQLKTNNYNQSNIKTKINTLGYVVEYNGLVSGLQDKIKAAGTYDIKYKNSQIGGDVDVTLENEVPYLNMAVSSQSINVTDFAEKKQASFSLISSAYAEEFIPDTDIPYEYLRMVDADITIDVKQIKIDNNITLNDVKGDVSLKNGVLKSNVQHVKFKNNVIDGKLEITSPKNRPYIKMNIKGDGFDINDFVSEKKTDKKVSLSFDWFISSAQASALMENITIPYQYLKMADADVNLSLKKISKGSEFSISDISINTNLKNSVLKSNIKNITAGDGKINGDITLNGSNKTLAVNVKGADIILQNLYKPFAQSGSSEVYIQKGGKTSFDAKINTSGNDTNQYLSNANGQIITIMDNSVVNVKSLEKLQGNIIVQILNTLKLNISHSDMKLECAVVRGDITSGVINFPKGIAFNADSFYLVADGKVNLKNDKIDLELQPFSGKITDVNISSILGNLIKITGTISNPSIGINQTATAKNVIGAIASGGAYNIGDLMLSADGAPCHTALKGTVYAEHFKGDNSVTGTVSSGYNSTKEVIGDLGDNIKSGAKEIKNQLKGLFH